MKNQKISIQVIIMVTVLILSGCGIFSLHPLYHKEDLIVKTDIIGTWQNDEDEDLIIVIDTFENSTYDFKIIDEKDTIKFKMGLVELDNQYFIDLFPHDNCPPLDGGDCYSLENLMKNYIPAHSFMKFDMIDEEIYLTEFDNERLIKLFEQNRIRLAHEITGDGDEDNEYVVITASTGDLQKFITRYAKDKDAFEETEKYHRL